MTTFKKAMREYAASASRGMQKLLPATEQDLKEAAKQARLYAMRTGKEGVWTTVGKAPADLTAFPADMGTISAEFPGKTGKKLQPRHGRRKQAAAARQRKAGTSEQKSSAS